LSQTNKVKKTRGKRKGKGKVLWKEKKKEKKGGVVLTTEKLSILWEKKERTR